MEGKTETIRRAAIARLEKIAEFHVSGHQCVSLALAMAILNEALAEATEEKVVTCAFCGKEYPRGTPRHGDQALAEHIKICPEHPMRAVEADMDRLRQQLAQQSEAHEESKRPRSDMGQ